MVQIRQYEPEVLCDLCFRELDGFDSETGDLQLCFACNRNRNGDGTARKPSPSPLKKIIGAAKRRAKEKNVPFAIRAGDILIPELCPVLGVKLEHNPKVFGDNSPSLDRFIPELGYVKGNVAVISWLANRLKSNGTAEQIRKIADWMEAENARRAATQLGQDSAVIL